MNAGIFVFTMITVVVVGMVIYLYTPAGKKWLKNL